MATPSAIFNEIVTTTLRKHRPSLADNVTNNNAFLDRLRMRGNIEIASGGYEIVEPLDYNENSTFQRYSGWQQLNIQASDVFTAAKYEWTQAAVNILASGRDLRMNSGKEQIIKLAQSRIKNGMNTMFNNIGSDTYSDGTLPNQITGLQAQVADSGTGTVGGIDSSVWDFWQNNVQDPAAPIQGGGAIVPSKDTIQSLMLPLWLRCTRGADKPDLLLADDTYFTYYEESLTDFKRYTQDNQGVGGFVSLKYKTADVIYDADGGNWASGMPNEHMYMLNTAYLRLIVHRDANFQETDEKMSVNQDGVIIPVIFMGNITCSARALQGVIIP